MLILGLTGGIASGKSTVSRTLEELGCAVIDTDVLARRVVEPGRPAWREVVKHFGECVLKEDGSIDREILGSIVFSDEQKRRVLNRCTHPYIRREAIWELAKNFFKGRSHVVLVSPLLFETKYALHYMRKTIVVSCTQAQQLSRLMTRDRLSEAEALKRIEAQIPLSSKTIWADVVIDNSRDALTTRRQTHQLVETMRREARCRWLLCRATTFTIFALLAVFMFALSLS